MSSSDISLFLQQGIVSGIVSGSVYALLALSVVMIFKTTDVPNFAQGEIFMGAGYVALYLVTVLLFDPRVAMICAVAATPLACGLFQRLVLSQAQRVNSSPVNLVIATLGFAYVLKGLARATGLGDSPRSLPPLLPTSMVTIGQAAITVLDVAILVMALTAMLGLLWMFTRTRLGKAMRAVGMNPRGARIVGISIERMHTIVWSLSGLLSAIAAVLLAPKILLTPDMGQIMMLAFAAAIIGGFNSLPGAVVGGVLVGIVENLVGLFVSTNAIVVAPFVTIMLVLLVRPQGLLGGRLQVKKV